MKKIFSFIVIFVSIFLLAGCGGKEKLYLLNWAQYISEDVIRDFEKEHNVKVVMDEVESNEIMYTKLKNNANPYDIAIPSDYMIHRLYEENLLVKLNYSEISNYKEEMFDSKLNELRNSYFDGNKDYAVPYMWGTLGIMYNKSKAGVEEAVKANEWNVFFEVDKLPAGSKVGMYESSRDAIAAAELYLGKSLNSTDTQTLNAAEEKLKGFSYSMWATDELKERIAEKNLDVALVYSGDFFDVYYNYLENNKTIEFDMHVPDVNNIWFDAMVIPTTSKNVTLAQKFINFMLDADNALENSLNVGYGPCISSIYTAMKNDADKSVVVDHPAFYPGATKNGEIYKYLGAELATEMQNILSRVKPNK